MSDDPIVAAVKDLLKEEAEVHMMYPNTATCRSGPGVVSGQAFTKHCGATCSNPVHYPSRDAYRAALTRLRELIEEHDNA